MADYFTLTYDIAATLGVAPEGLDIVHALVKSQYSGIADTDSNIVKPGTWALEINATTTAGTIDLPSTVDDAFNPAGAMYVVEVKYNDRPSGKTVTWRSSPPGEAFAMDADKNLADVVAEPVTVVTEALRDEVFATAAAIAELEATNDGIMTAVASDPESSFAAQQLATTARIKAWARDPETLIAGTITYDSTGLIATAGVIWPDSATGVFTATTSSAYGIDAYTVTYDDGTTELTFTQPAFTRDATGAVTNRPDLAVS